jgi:outer membrane protein OmpA-like peptidoglycan-associated protein
MKTLNMFLVGASLAAAAPAIADSKPPNQQLADVYFGFDSDHVNVAETLHLATITTWAKDHPDARIVLDGNADSVGDTRYNVRLALRRAESVQAKLVAAGLDKDRIVLVTYGEDNVRHSSPGLDRRVTIWATREPLRDIVDGALVRATAVVWNDPVEATALQGPRPIPVATR